MKATSLATTMALCALSPSTLAAQDTRTPMQIARAQEACGANQNAQIISSDFLEDGRVSVRCARGGLFGTGIGAAAASEGFGGAATAGVVFTTLILVAAAAGGSSSTSDTR